MAVQLNHTIVRCRDSRVSARFLAEMLGRPAPRAYGPFMMVQLDNGAALEFLAVPEQVTPQHYAFLVADDEFEPIFQRILERGLPFWGGPEHQGLGVTNNWNGGRGVYFDDPDGHSLEVITRPYVD